MTKEKVVPHMTDLIKILKNEKYFREFLNQIKGKKVPKEESINLFMDLPVIDLARSTSNRYIGSLHQFAFLIKENDELYLSKYSEQYLAGKINYNEYILKCLCRNLEWAHFLPDIHKIIEENGPVGIKEIIELLDEKNYETDESTTARYLSEILKILDITDVIVYEDGVAKTTESTMPKNEINYFARAVQRDLINLLQMADRRKENLDIRKLRKIYYKTVKAYIPRREHRSEALNTLKETEEIRKTITSTDGKETETLKESKWALVDDLWDWQSDFHERWMNKRRGIAKVVTGAGKTHLAMAIMESLKQEFDNLNVTIIVPTIVLQEQWYENLVEKLQISSKDIGRRGGDYKDDFEGNDVLITVINSAIKNDFIKKATQDIENNLLIVDECHRAGAPEFRNVFKAKRRWELGLSATPERERDEAFENVLVDELGQIIGSYRYKDALDDGIIPGFNIYNYAVMLSNGEKREYEKLTRQIRNIVKRLKMKYPFLEKSNMNFEAALHSLKDQNPEDKDLYSYFQKTKKRKEEIVYPAKNRKKLVKDMIRGAIPRRKYSSPFEEDSTLNLSEEDRVMLFHESIDEVNSLFMELDSPFVSIYHSEFPNSLNRIGLELYKKGSTNILLSVKALIEGVDVPKTNVGIIMASSSSITQRVQSLGRVLRKAEGKDETKMIIPYVKGTTDESIYYKKDWDKIVGKKNIEFRMWTEFGEVDTERPKPPKKRKYQDIETIDENMLEIGEEYSGKYEGEEYSFDHRGKLFEKDNSNRSYFDYDLNDLWKEFRKYKPSGGKLKINRLGHILTSNKEDGDYQVLYLGNIKKINEEAGEDLVPDVSR